MGTRPIAGRNALLVVAIVGLAACGAGNGGTDASPSDGPSGPPTVIATTPSDGALAVPRASVVVVRFSRPMLSTSVTVAIAPSLALAATEWNESGDAVTLFPAAPLVAATAYTVTVAGAARDGELLSGSLAFGFTTAPPVESTPPEIVDFVPANEDACSTAVAIGFSEPMDPRSLTVSARPGHALGVPRWSNGLRRVTFPDTPAWRANNLVDVDVAGNDLAGNAVSQRFTFWTCPLPVVAPEIVSTYPSHGASDVAPGTHLRITFSQQMNAGPTRFAVTTSPPLACLRHVPPKFIGYFDDTDRSFHCHAGAAANTTYIVTVRGADDTGALNLATSQAGVLLPETFSFVFTTGPDPFDVVAPRVTSIGPPSGSRDVPVGTALVISFDEEMDPTSGQVQFAMTPPFHDRVWSEPPTQVTYRFTSDFPENADLGYTLTAFRDAAGNVMPDAAASFSTPGRAVSIATSDPTRDGTVERPGNARAGGTAIFVGVTGPTAAQKNARGFVSFALPPAMLARSGVFIHRAYLVVDQSSASPSPLGGHNPMHATSVALGAMLDAADHDVAALTGNIDAIDVFDGTTVGLHAFDVTNAVTYDLANRVARGDRSELRLAFEHELDGSLPAGIVGIAAGESSTPPQLWIDYSYSR